MRSDNRVPPVRTSAGFATKISVLVVVVLEFLASAGCGGGGTNAANNSGGDGGSGPVAAKVSGTIAAGTNPVAIAVDSTTNKIYVADFGQGQNNGQCQTCFCPLLNGTLTVIDGATQTPTTTPFSYTYSNPMDLAVDPTSHTFYVASRVFYQVLPTCGFFDNVAVFATTTLTQTASTHVGSAFNFAQIAVNQNTGHVYAEDSYDGTITVLDASGNVLDQITLPTHPSSLAVNPTTNRIYVTGNGIIVIDGAIDSVISTITDPNIVSPGVVAVNPATNSIYVSNTQSCNGCPVPDNIVVIDGASDSVTGTITVGSGPGDIAVDPQTNFIYVTHGAHDNNPGSVTVINAATNATSTLTDPSLVGPFRVAVNPATNKIYVANSGNNNITVIDGAHN